MRARAESIMGGDQGKTAMAQRKLLLRGPTALAQRQPDAASASKPLGRRRIAEMAGETAAECAAIWCCCPCGLLNLVVLALVKLPAGLVIRALRRQRRVMRKHSRGGAAALRLLGGPKGKGRGRGSTGEGEGEGEGKVEGSISDDEVAVGDLRIHASAGSLLLAYASDALPAKSLSPEEVSQLEKEMWAQFYSAGFWRSLSQREY
ncbi:uncharacterized protein LOC109707836 [Ananas comosus]|uniref:Uncharacterized protein LOC109707836 n=1 Tax=Ananas comosus TaxID=4615 RepID=A0A6P5EN92_ANACO|nr:uncharacterized protein LOC109707836 [Ananas comosus]